MAWPHRPATTGLDRWHALLAGGPIRRWGPHNHGTRPYPTGRANNGLQPTALGAIMKRRG
jgi:hypothetical protein